MRLVIDFPDDLDLPGIFAAEYPAPGPLPSEMNDPDFVAPEPLSNEQQMAEQIRRYVVSVVGQHNLRQALEVTTTATLAEAEQLPINVSVV